MLLHHLHRTLERPRHEEVVGREQHDEVAVVSPLEALVGSRDQALILFVTAVVDPLVGGADPLGDGGGVVGRAVVDDQHLDLDALLRGDAAHAALQQVPVAVARDDHLDERGSYGDGYRIGSGGDDVEQDPLELVRARLPGGRLDAAGSGTDSRLPLGGRR